VRKNDKDLDKVIDTERAGEWLTGEELRRIREVRNCERGLKWIKEVEKE
jgi:hypothetical protein